MFGPEHRLRLCLGCGATFGVPLAGGEVTCPGCGQVSHLAPRTLAPLGEGAGDGADPAAEAERQARLRRQAERYNPDHPYAFHRPGHLAEVASWRADDPQTLPRALAVFRREVARAEAGGDREVHKGVFFLALWLRNLGAERGEVATVHAVYHTALDALVDRGYQHVLRCGLAELSRREGEHAAAEGWLALCDPAPTILDLDADYRVCLAFAAARREDFTRVLALVGARDGESPYDPPNVANFGALRVAALEGLGRAAEAEAAMRWLLDRPVLSPGFVRRMLRRSPELSPGLRVWARFAPEAAAGVDGGVTALLGIFTGLAASATILLLWLGALSWREATASTGILLGLGAGSLVLTLWLLRLILRWRRRRRAAIADLAAG